MALESLGVTSEKYACMLAPLIESALPESILREWERKRMSCGIDESSLFEAADQMVKLRDFLKREVESEERFLLARSTFSVPSAAPKSSAGNVKSSTGKYTTAADLVGIESTEGTEDVSCIFCKNSHNTELCSEARAKSKEEKIKLLKAKSLYFKCLKKFHGKRPCKEKLCCLVCAEPHVTVVCPIPRNQNSTTIEISKATKKENDVEHNYASIQSEPVLMQTLRVRLKGENPVTTRLLIDTGSQRSYITQALATRMRYEPIRTENLVHALFGGSKTEPKTHQCYKIRLQSLMSAFSCNFEVLDSEQICHAIPSIPKGLWVSELREKKIELTDDREGPIGILVGADVAGKLLTGRREVLSCGLVAIETSLGWTIMGRVKDAETSCMVNISLHCAQEFDPSDMWRLDVLGIEDPALVSTKEEAKTVVRRHFLETVKILPDGRYDVCLPWLKEHPPLPRNFDLARGRLESTLAKLRNGHLVKEYEAVFQEWLKDEIIEEVQLDKWDFGHYLPHRAVVKEASTTRIRPVFVASSKEKGKPNLNMCLEKGGSCVELIPSILLRFSLNAIGVISDIRKAFLQISVSEKDRDSLRFLWKDEVGEMKIYRHRRVVFGVTSSPYLLGTVIDHHLSKCEEKVASKEVPYERSVISQLRKCLYVDNCVTSVDDEKELLSFMSQAREIFMKACFDLRGWEWSDPDCAAHTSFPVLGLLWDKKEDILRLNSPKPLESDAITRQTVMSAAHRIFDPLGVCAPAILIPRLLVQESWGEAGNWDTPFNEQSQATFRKWMSQADALNQIEVPRWLKLTVGNVSLHTFCDASQVAYATVSFLRVETDNTVSVIMVGAKVRVAPVKRPTIPRLELLAATIGARMASSIVKEIGDVECHFWSDSSTALCWIKKEEPWGVFVFNRVK
ncbi:uncharacterized protein LOC130452213 [Diorhabda sublineata]|uniref:uncharacterized protein LOC130452213 n=1 Tax=Diorhabda sublineata TaxID=1163346 RepID=UPI0024E0C5CD|nr:uncharacterized protein LOC130452213 [Diorhabda sublineata]